MPVPPYMMAVELKSNELAPGVHEEVRGRRQPEVSAIEIAETTVEEMSSPRSAHVQARRSAQHI